MKKLLLLIIISLSCLTANAQQENNELVSLTKVNYVGLKDLSELGFDNAFEPEEMEIVPDGLGLNNPQLQDKLWTPQFPFLGNIQLEEGHDYVIRLTMKVPSDGTYWVDMCSWSVGYSYARHVPVVAGDDFQIIDVEYPEYGRSITDGMVFIGWGGVVGTTILKEVELLERKYTTGINDIKVAYNPHNDVFNLSGQKVNTTYKGIVIRNGKRVVIK
ncbi:MAG: hypothetical protein IKX65_08260 [Prevotella sp.]|nr:hypothetical protein [Prevotella sp.]